MANQAQNMFDINSVSITEGSSIPTYTISASTPWLSSNTAIWSATDTGSLTSGSPFIKPSGKLSLTGEQADIEINGQSLLATLKRIEERINILTVNHDLESEWEELRELGKQYRELEQHIKDKMETWAKLKAQDNDNR